MHELLALGAPHPLVLERPQCTLEALLVVTRHRHAAETQALAYLQTCQQCRSQTLIIGAQHGDTSSHVQDCTRAHLLSSMS